MIRKGPGCVGCPWEKKGEYFTPDTLVPGSEVMFLAQNPGPNEEAGQKLKQRHYFGSGIGHDEVEIVRPQPLIGATGILFNTKFLPRADLHRSDVSVGNAIRCRPGKALGLQPDELPTLTNKMEILTSKAEAVQAIRHCAQAHLQVPSGTKIIVTMGNYPWFQLTGQHTVTDWRGYALPRTFPTPYVPDRVDSSYYRDCRLDVPGHVIVYCTLHIAALHKGDNKRYYHATLNDFGKLARLRGKQWPCALPHWSDTPPHQWPAYAAFDTEYTRDSPHSLIRWSLCSSDHRLFCVEAPDSKAIAVEKGSTVLMQNALADIGFLSQIIDISQIKIEDLMLAHSVLWTGEPHSLNYIASLYGAFNRYKHLSENQVQLYSALDAFEPMYIWRHHIIPEMRRDPVSWEIYKKYTLPLVPIINKAQLTGIKLDRAKLEEAQAILQARVDEMRSKAHEAAGEIFNLGGSLRVKELIYGGLQQRTESPAPDTQGLTES